MTPSKQELIEQLTHLGLITVGKDHLMRLDYQKLADFILENFDPKLACESPSSVSQRKNVRQEPFFHREELEKQIDTLATDFQVEAVEIHAGAKGDYKGSRKEFINDLLALFDSQREAAVREAMAEVSAIGIRRKHAEFTPEEHEVYRYGYNNGYSACLRSK